MECIRVKKSQKKAKEANPSPRDVTFELCTVFFILAIIFSPDIQIRWFKLHWKATQRPTTFMKKLLGDNIISMDKNALEVTAPAQDGDFSCQMVPFQLYTNFNHL